MGFGWMIYCVMYRRHITKRKYTIMSKRLGSKLSNYFFLTLTELSGTFVQEIWGLFQSNQAWLYLVDKMTTFQF